MVGFYNVGVSNNNMNANMNAKRINKSNVNFTSRTLVKGPRDCDAILELAEKVFQLVTKSTKKAFKCEPADITDKNKDILHSVITTFEDDTVHPVELDAQKVLADLSKMNEEEQTNHLLKLFG